jgi:hypothetical protein
MYSVMRGTDRAKPLAHAARMPRASTAFHPQHDSWRASRLAWRSGGTRPGLELKEGDCELGRVLIKIAIGDSDLIKSALTHFADSSWTSPDVREVPLPDLSRCSRLRNYSITSSTRASSRCHRRAGTCHNGAPNHASAVQPAWVLVGSSKPQAAKRSTRIENKARGKR